MLSIAQLGQAKCYSKQAPEVSGLNPYVLISYPDCRPIWVSEVILGPRFFHALGPQSSSVYILQLTKHEKREAEYHAMCITLFMLHCPELSHRLLPVCPGGKGKVNKSSLCTTNVTRHIEQ